MNLREMVASIFLIIVIIAGIIAINYMELKENKEMALTGLEQCPINPTWVSKGTIWVKDCNKYMKSWEEVQK